MSKNRKGKCPRRGNLETDSNGYDFENGVWQTLALGVVVVAVWSYFFPTFK